MAELATLAATTAGTNAALAGMSTFGPATATALSATTGGQIASFLSSSVLSSLGSGLTLASMASDIFGGVSQGKAAAQQLTQQSEQDLLNAKQEELAGQQEANDIQDNLLQTIASQRLAYSGAGIDFSFGTPAQLEKNLNRRAEMQFGTSRDNTRLKTLARRREAYLKLSQRGAAQRAPVMAGVASAGRTLAGSLS